MDQAGFQQAGASAPVLSFQQGNDPETVGLEWSDAGCSQIVTPFFGRSHVVSLDAGAGLLPSPDYTEIFQRNHLPWPQSYTGQQPGLDTPQANKTPPLQPQLTYGTPKIFQSHAEGFQAPGIGPALVTDALSPPQSYYGPPEYFQNYVGGYQAPSVTPALVTDALSPPQSYYGPPEYFQNYVEGFEQAGLPLSPCNAVSGSEQVLSGSLALVIQNFGGLPSNPRRRPQVCVMCWLRRKKCEIDAQESRCLFCCKEDIPAQICGQERITKHRPFEKWWSEEYKILFTMVRSSGLSSHKTVELRHYPDGPTLNVECCEFLATNKNQTRVVRKNLSGWHWMKTTPYCLKNPKIDISQYVLKCIKCSVGEACGRGGPVSFFFKLACHHRENFIIRRCMELYTTLRLLSIGWHFAGSESLGMATVGERDSLWFGEKPVPRMIQNQLNHRLELRAIELDKEILGIVEPMMEKRERRNWVLETLVLFLLLHVREVDAGRNIYWHRYIDLGGFWIHPSKPTTLLEEVTTSCNSILSLFHCSIGRKPLDLNWDDNKSKEMVDNDLKFVNSMKSLQACISKLRTAGLIGRKACNLYKAGDPNSVDFTASSLLFETMEEGCEVKGFH